MAYPQDTEFHDEDLPKSASFPYPAPGFSGVGSAKVASTTGVPSPDQLAAEVTDRAQQLVALRERQSQIERAKAELEELRRRRAEFDTGRAEMRDQLTRAVSLLEQTEQAARREAERSAKSLGGLRQVAAAIQQLSEKAWSAEGWHQDLSRDLAVIENARNELNSAREKWPVLNGSANAEALAKGDQPETLATMSFGRLARVGLAVTWPLLLLGVLGFIALALLIIRK